MSMIRAGRLDRRVQILRRQPAVHDGYQNLPGGWAAVGGRWASVRPRMGREAVEAAGREGRAPMSFWFRFDELTRSLTTEDALEMDGTHYAIIAPPIEIGRREGVEVLAVAGGLPVVLEDAA